MTLEDWTLREEEIKELTLLVQKLRRSHNSLITKLRSGDEGAFNYLVQAVNRGGLPLRIQADILRGRASVFYRLVKGTYDPFSLGDLLDLL